MRINFNNKGLFFHLVFVLMPYIFIFSQAPQIQFEHLHSDEGPSQSLITAIYQDSKGYMWFGTYDGLYKYDGYRFTVYKNRAFDTTSIPGNYIQSIIEDHKGDMWIGTQTSGVSEYNRTSDSFTNYTHNPRNNNSIAGNKIWSLAEDSRGSIWIGTSQGLDKFDQKKKLFTHFTHKNNDSTTLNNNAVNSIHEDKDGILWLGTFGGGLNYLNLNDYYKTGKAKFHSIYFYRDNYEVSGINRIKDIYEDSTGYLWLATYGGIIKFNKKSENYNIYVLKNKYDNIPNQNALLTLVEDKEGRIWAGSHNSGLCMFDKTTGQFYTYEKTPNPNTSINDIYVPSLFIDRTGILWVGTGRGINKVLPYYDNFENLSNNPSDHASLGSNEVNTIFEDSSDNIWIGTWGGGLSKFNQSSRTFKNYKYDKNNRYSIPDNTVWCICQAPDKNLLIGTYSGLTKFIVKKGIFIRDYLKNAKLTHYNVSAVLYDKYGDLWVGTYGGGLNRLKKGTDKFEYYQYDPKNSEGISDNFITTMYQDKEGTLWIGTHAGGLNAFNRDNNTFKNYQYNPKSEFSLSNNNIRCITEDSTGDLWIGTWGGGLNMFDKKQQRFYHYTEKNGLANNLVFGILEDNSGNLWISTNNGLSKFTNKTKSFRNFHEEDGIGGEQFGYGYLRASNGLMYFGSLNGLTIFNPDKLTMNTHIPPVVITSFKRFNKAINFRKELLKYKRIQLEYVNNEFTVDFAALDYTRPAKNNYAYKLDGYDKFWTYSKNVHSAHYTNLQPGFYNFRVRASNNDDYWNETGASIIIEIVPPFWDTTWFKTSVILLLLLLIYAGYRIRVKTIAARNEMLEELVGKRTEQLESEIFVRKKAEEALIQSEEKLKILNANKDKFFSLISHDLKSPFFSLLGYGSILENDFENFSRNEIKDVIVGMNVLIRKVSDLTENLLQWAKVQTGRISFEPQKIDLVKLIEKPMSVLMLSAENKEIKIENSISPDCKVEVDVNMISSVIQNLITNAIKFSEPGSKISLCCKASNGMAEICVSDTGVGISDDNLKRLFKIEEQFTTKGTKEETGSGLGLNLMQRVRGKTRRPYLG